MMFGCCVQDLPSEAVEEDLIESGQAGDILEKVCPAEYSNIREEEVGDWKRTGAL